MILYNLKLQKTIDSMNRRKHEVIINLITILVTMIILLIINSIGEMNINLKI